MNPWFAKGMGLIFIFIFILLSLLLMTVEFFDIPHVLFGTLHTPLNWHRVIIETIIIFSVGFFALLFLNHVVKERDEVKNAMMESEKGFFNLIEQVNDGIAVIQDKSLKYVNQKLVDMWDHDVKELLGTHFTDYIHPKEIKKVVGYYDARMQGKEVEPTYQTVLLRRNGSKMCVELSAGLIAYEGRAADLIIIRDISQRIKADKDQRQNSERFKALAENAPFAISIMKPDGVFEYFNPRFNKIFGYTIEDFADKEAWFEAVYPDEAYRKKVVSKWKTDLVKGIEKKEPTPRIFSVRCKDGQEKSIRFKSATLKDRRQFLTYEDITQQKKYGSPTASSPKNGGSRDLGRRDRSQLQ